MKGLLRGFRYISQIFGEYLNFSLNPRFFFSSEFSHVNMMLNNRKAFDNFAEDEKEPEMQIGLPTDVKHVAHIGMDGPSANKPSWVC